MEDTFFSKCSHHCGYTYFYNIAYNAAMLRLYKYIVCTVLHLLLYQEHCSVFLGKNFCNKKGFVK